MKRREIKRREDQQSQSPLDLCPRAPDGDQRSRPFPPILSALCIVPFPFLHLHSLHRSPPLPNHPFILASSHRRQTSGSAAVGTDLFTLLSPRYTFTIEMVLFCIEMVTEVIHHCILSKQVQMY